MSHESRAATCLWVGILMAERRKFRSQKHQEGLELSYRNWASAVLGLLIALGIAFLGGYAVYCFMTRFGE